MRHFVTSSWELEEKPQVFFNGSTCILAVRFTLCVAAAEARPLKSDRAYGSEVSERVTPVTLSYLLMIFVQSDFQVYWSAIFRGLASISYFDDVGTVHYCNHVPHPTSQTSNLSVNIVVAQSQIGLSSLI